MKTVKLCLVVLGVFAFVEFCRPPGVDGHGTAHRVIRDSPAITVETFYADKAPMRYAEVMLYAPSDHEVEYQNGRTDKNGRFAFFPDQAGTWRIEVSDGMGHLMKTAIDVSRSKNAAAPGRPPGSLDSKHSMGSMPIKVAFGLSLIANVVMFVILWKTKKQQSR